MLSHSVILPLMARCTTVPVCAVGGEGAVIRSVLTACAAAAAAAAAAAVVCIAPCAAPIPNIPKSENRFGGCENSVASLVRELLLDHATGQLIR